MNKVNVLNVNFDALTTQEFQQHFLQKISHHESTLVVTANPEIVMAANENPEYLKLINQEADFVTADGYGVLKGAKILGKTIPERVTGYDLFVWFLDVANQQHKRVYLIGAKPVVIEKTKERVLREYPGIKLVGAEDGYFTEPLDVIARKIEKSEADFVFAAIGYPRQEQLLAILRKKEFPAIMMGIGGSFDVFSGTVKRAPQIFQAMHLEWFYRLLKDPTRFKRMLVLPKFIQEVKRSKRR